MTASILNSDGSEISMTVLSANNLGLYYGANMIFENVTFSVDEKDRIALVGINGCGKTSLLKLITGENLPDSGDISVNKLASLGYMEQFTLLGGRSVYDEALTVFKPLMELDAELSSVTARLASGDTSPELIDKQHFLTEEYEKKGGLTFENRTRAALIGLGFTESDLSRDIGELSGGQRSKIQLCKMLLSGASLLLLDEPTNHLDINAVEWLESFLLSYNGAYIIISHDRYFLEKVTNRTFELENHHLTSYKGAYSSFLKQKEENREIALRHYENTQREIHRIEGIIEQQKRWNQAHNYITIASKQKQIDRIAETLVGVDNLPSKLKFNFNTKPTITNNILICDRLTAGYGEKKIFSELNLSIHKGERVFLLGPNGCGKSTLFKVLVGQLAGKYGSVTYGPNVEYGYYEQTQASLHDNKTVLNEVWDVYPRMTETEIRTALGSFLFRGEDVFKLISNLSGGEKARISILKLMLSQANFLLLDEPTNHLDITSREALENAIADYEGTVFIISHDRYFINKLADRLYYMDEGRLTEYSGNYDYFEQRRPDRPSAAAAAKTESTNAADYRRRKEEASAARKRKTSISRTEAALEEIAEKIAELENRISQPDVAADYQLVLEITNDLNSLKEHEDELFIKLDELYSQEAQS